MATFTALNGGSPKSAEGINGSADAPRASPTERPNGQVTTGNSIEVASARPAGEVSTSQRDRENWTGASHDRPPYPSATYPDVEGSSHKRKRSGSEEPRREKEREPRRTPPPAERPESRDPHRPQSESRDRYGTPPREYRAYAEDGRDSRDSREHNDSWYAQRPRDEQSTPYERHHSGGPNSAQSDEQIGETLRRATSQLDASDYENTSPGGDERSSSVYAGQYSDRRDPVVQSDPKKRKRNFSNRTKTGCLTCRKRKKKCDETKPECKFQWTPSPSR